MKKKKRKKNTRNEFTLVHTLNLLHVILLRGFPKRSLFKRSKVFSFEEKEKNLKGHPERKSKEKEKKIGSLIPRVSFEGWLPLPLPHSETQKDR